MGHKAPWYIRRCSWEANTSQKMGANLSDLREDIKEKEKQAET